MTLGNLVPSPLSAISLCVEWGWVSQDQGSHSSNPKLLTRDGRKVCQGQIAESLSPSVAILKELGTFAIRGA